MHVIIIKLKDGSTETRKCVFDWQALAVCEEEIKWENTERVICESIGFDEEN